jgi:outer membrane protein assembly factor BamB
MIMGMRAGWAVRATVRMSALAGLAVTGITGGPVPARAVSPVVRAGVVVSWPQYQGNARHTGYNSQETTLGPGNVAGLHLLWVGSTSGAAAGISAPSIAGGRVFLGTFGDDTLRAWNATTGAADWGATGMGGGGGFESTPAVAGGRVFIKDNAGFLYAFSAATGTLQWSSQGWAGVGPPTLAGGLLYAQDSLGNLDALSPATGAVLWSTHLQGDAIKSAPAVAGGRVFVTGSERVYSLVALDASTGTVLWRKGIGHDQLASPVVSGAQDVYACFTSGLYSFAAAAGHKRWSQPDGCDWDSTPAVAQGVVYTDPDGEGGGPDGLHAFSAATGALLWHAGTGTNAAPVIANGVVYASTGSGTITAYDTATHALLWTSPAHGFTTLAVVNGTLYAGGDNGLYAFGL